MENFFIFQGYFTKFLPSLLLRFQVRFIELTKMGFTRDLLRTYMGGTMGGITITIIAIKTDIAYGMYAHILL